jgi:hypothetical protein
MRHRPLSKRAKKLNLGAGTEEEELLTQLIKAAEARGSAKTRALLQIKKGNRRGSVGYFAAHYRLSKRCELLRKELLKRFTWKQQPSSSEESSSDSSSPSPGSVP